MAFAQHLRYLHGAIAAPEASDTLVTQGGGIPISGSGIRRSGHISAMSFRNLNLHVGLRISVAACASLVGILPAFLLVVSPTTSAADSLPSPDQLIAIEPEVTTVRPFESGGCFDIAEDAFGRIYAGGRAGVAMWDGIRWTHLSRIPVIQSRSMAHIGGRLYLLSKSKLYRAELGGLPSLDLVSVSDDFEQGGHPFEFKELARVGDALYLMNAGHIVKLTVSPDGKENVEVWSASDLTTGQNRFWRIRPAGPHLVVQTGEYGTLSNNGLIRIDNGDLNSINVINRKMGHLIDFAAIDSAGEDLVLLSTQALFRLASNQMERIPFDGLTTPSGQPDRIRQVHANPHGAPIVKTMNNGIFLLDKSGRRAEQRIPEYHLPGAVTVKVDSLGRLWLPSLGGLHICSINSGVVNYPMSAKLSRVSAHGDWLVCASRSGLLVSRLSPETGLPVEPLKQALAGWIHNVVRNDNTLFICSPNGIYTCDLADELDNPDSYHKTQIDGPHTRNIFFIDGQSVIVAFDDRIEQWKKQDGAWTRSQPLGNFRTTNSCALFDNAFWFIEDNAAKDRLVRIDWTNPRLPQTFDGESGLLFVHEQRLYIAPGFQSGVFRVFNESENRFEQAPVLSRLRDRDGKTLVVSSVKEISPRKLQIGTQNAGLLEVDLDGEDATTTTLLSPRHGKLTSVSQGQQDIIWASTWKDSCIAVKRRTDSPSESRARAVLSSVGLLQPRSAEDNQPVQIDSPSVNYLSPHNVTVRMPYTAQTLRFRYGIPNATDQPAIRFQYRLQPLSPAWSPPQADGYCDYAALWEGSYEFQVRGILADGSITQPSTVSLRIDAPWHRSTVALSLYALLIASGLIYLHRRRTKRHAKHTASLQAEIARRVTVENDLRKSQQEVIKRERLAALNEMAASVAHDVNNMLGPIAIYNELAQHDSSLPDTYRRQSQICTTLAIDAAEIIRRLNPLYRSVAQDHENLELQTVVEHCAQITREICSQLGQHDIKVVTECEPAQVQCSPSELREVITNLTTNAIDAVQGKGALTLRCGKTDTHTAYIEVSDDGCGMDAETAKNCFSRDFTFGKTGGAGIGLAVSKSIISSYGGTISVETGLGKGTTMKIQIPVNLSVGTNPNATTDSIGESHILVVDDVQVTRDGVRQLLQSMGQQVSCVESAQEALLWLRENKCDIVLTDYRMTGMSGYELCQQIRECFPGTRVVIMTGHEEPGIRETADAFLLKPLSSQSMKFALRQLENAPST